MHSFWMKKTQEDKAKFYDDDLFPCFWTWFKKPQTNSGLDALCYSFSWQTVLIDMICKYPPCFAAAEDS